MLATINAPEGDWPTGRRSLPAYRFRLCGDPIAFQTFALPKPGLAISQSVSRKAQPDSPKKVTMSTRVIWNLGNGASAKTSRQHNPMPIILLNQPYANRKTEVR
jgi:hypothetical protein